MDRTCGVIGGDRVIERSRGMGNAEGGMSKVNPNSKRKRGVNVAPPPWAAGTETESASTIQLKKQNVPNGIRMSHGRLPLAQGSRSTRGGAGPIGASPDTSGRQGRDGWICWSLDDGLNLMPFQNVPVSPRRDASSVRQYT